MDNKSNVLEKLFILDTLSFGGQTIFPSMANGSQLINRYPRSYEIIGIQNEGFHGGGHLMFGDEIHRISLFLV